MLLLPWLLALALCAPQKKDKPPKPRPPPLPKAMLIVCTPTTIACDGGPAVPAENALADALTRAAPGARIELGSGDYANIGIGYDRDAKWNARTSGGTRGAPVTVLGKGKARIVGKEDAITVSQQVKNGFITFQNLEFSPGSRSAVLFSQGEGWVHEGYRFLDCDIVGEWNHLTDSGARSSKWGVYGRGLKDFEFRGVSRRVRIVDLRREHAFYLQNLRGDVLIEKVDVARVGRTFIQVTAREKEGPPGVGTVTIRDCTGEDCCIAAGDSNKGGSAFTFCGRFDGTILLQRTRYRAGFQAPLRKLTRPEAPYGTGALVAWDGGEGVPTARLVLEDVDFEFAQGCGDRPLAGIGACTNVELRGACRLVSGGNPAALELEPVREARPEGSTVGALSVDPRTVIQGPIRWRGENLTLDALLSKFSRASVPPAGGAGPKPPPDPPHDH
ncbi:MAG TPA: hypothetical protein VM509_03580 [Planctomycetota bacterium]|nr:hypothetical protein [Planctomycetota bacterium]